MEPELFPLRRHGFLVGAGKIVPLFSLLSASVLTAACELFEGGGGPTAPSDPQSDAQISSDGGVLGHRSTVLLPADRSDWTTFGPISVNLDGTSDVGDRGTVRFGVRDYECEDGDRVSVNVHNARTGSHHELFRGEIFNRWQWRDYTVTAGYHYTVDVVALNGTGFKGNCSFHNENTGELFISNVNDRGNGGRWSTTGGAGARTIVNVHVP